VSFSIKERMHEACQALDEKWTRWPIDWHMECEDEWTRDYAIITISVQEPEDEGREFFNLYAVQTALIDFVKGFIGASAHVVRGRRTPADMRRPLLLQTHVLAGGWDMEVEVYRPKPEKKRREARPKKRVA
jgi:hypothetical protein